MTGHQIIWCEFDFGQFDSHDAFDTNAIFLNCVSTRWLKGDCQRKLYFNLGFDFVQTQLKSKDIISLSLCSAAQISRQIPVRALSLRMLYGPCRPSDFNPLDF